MGYTHYWHLNANANAKNYKKALTDCRKIIRHCTEDYNLCDAWGNEGSKPSLRNGIAFNGCEDESHETFSLPKQASNSPGFDFCKTARKEYDAVVVACLVALKDNLGDDIDVSSDGSNEPDMWVEGMEIAEQVLGRNVQLPFINEE